MRPLLTFLIVRLLFGILLIWSGVITLDADEAQYWTWSQALDWGYYSKPPGIAWEIFLGTSLLGNTVAGIRFAPLLLGLLIPLSLYRLAKSAKLSESAALAGALLFAFCPLGVLGGLLATTDGGMILFWTLACAYFLSKRDAGAMLGVFIGLGALFKWTAFILWIPLLLFSSNRRALLSGISISLVALLPSLYWNANHDWATFKHVWGNMSGGPAGSSAPKAPGNPVEFIGAQVALLTPAIFILSVLAHARALVQWSKLSHPIRFSVTTTLLILGTLTTLAFFQRIQGNWGAYAYPTAFLSIAWYLHERRHLLLRWSILGVSVSMLTMLSITGIAALQTSNTKILSYRVLPKMHPFHQFAGHDRLPALLHTANYAPEREFLFSDQYQLSSLLSFFSPDQERAYFFNLNGQRRNQFSYWPGMESERVGQSSLFITRGSTNARSDLEDRLAEYFEKVSCIGTYPLYESYGEPKKTVLIFRCHKYIGGVPPARETY